LVAETVKFSAVRRIYPELLTAMEIPAVGDFGGSAIVAGAVPESQAARRLAMRSYRLQLLNRDGSIDSFELGDFTDDMRALRDAKAALHVSLSAVSGEVWRGDQSVGRILRDSGRAKASTGMRKLAG
jgi:hypothetical protein